MGVRPATIKICERCGRRTDDYYRRSPESGRSTPQAAVCAECYERAAALAQSRLFADEDEQLFARRKAESQ